MLQWSEKYAVGIKVIDDQHQKFFAIFNELYDAFLGGGTEDNLAAALKAITDYTEYHFSLEERYFREFVYAGSEEHIRQHDIFRARIAGLKKLYFAGADQAELAAETVDLLDNWLIKHVVEMDRQYVDCFREHGLTV